MNTRKTVTVAVVTSVCAAMIEVAAGNSASVGGYLDFKKGSCWIVDGQRVEVNGKTRLDAGKYKQPAEVPLGYMVKSDGIRGADGRIVASRVKAAKNGMEFTESDVLAGTNAAEKSWVQAKKVAEPAADGKTNEIGTLIEIGPQVDRCRRIIDRLLPPYVDPKKVRVYVVDNPQWNAMAMANFSIYVFSGLMKDMDDDELAIVLGHELAHATYEHSRRQAKGGVFSGVAGQLALLGAAKLDNDLAREAATQATGLGVTTFGNSFSREYEDQADRVGLRYVYEAGYDYRKAPALWNRFAAKYGDQDKVTNFFFGNHSLSAKRAKNLQAEINRNYKDPAKDPPLHARTTPDPVVRSDSSR
jgi:Zn-dependent protease with chaperone function